MYMSPSSILAISITGVRTFRMGASNKQVGNAVLQGRNNMLQKDHLTTRRTATRPHSTKLFTYDTVTVPHYTEEYCKKPVDLNSRSAKAYNDKRNIPHPSEGFMVWRLPLQFPPLMEHALQATAQLNPDRLIAEHKITSTYQGDYTGAQQGNVPLPLDMLPKYNTTTKDAPSRALLSSMQISYRVPRQSSNLKGNTTRYGCSEGIVRAAQGIVPTLANSKQPLTASYQTWYNSEFTASEENKSESLTTVKLPKIDTTEMLPQLTTRASPIARDKCTRNGCCDSNKGLRQLFA